MLAAFAILGDPVSGYGDVPPVVVQEVTVDTLAGGHIVVSNPAPGRGGGPDEWRLVEELRLGRVDGTGPEVFGDVHDVAVDGKGHIYVLDVGSKEVRVFDREGRHLRDMVRNGGGPGEKQYRNVFDHRLVWQPPNRLWIGDGRQQLSVDSLGNELSRVGSGFDDPSSKIVAADAQGFAHQEVRIRDRSTSGDEIITRRRTYGVRMPVYPEHPSPVLPQDSVVLDGRTSTLMVQSRANSGRTMTTSGIVRVSIPRRVWAFTAGETVWVANRAAYRFHEVTFAGDTVRTVELGNPPPPPPDDSEESEFKPRIADLNVSPEGWLWVLRYPDDPERDPPAWDLFDNCGRYRGEVSTSARIGTVRFDGVTIDPVEVGADGVVHAPARDALGVSYVVRLRLESARGTPVAAETCPY